MNIKHKEIIEAYLKGLAIKHKNPISDHWFIFRPDEPLINPISYPNFQWEIINNPLLEAAKNIKNSPDWTLSEAYCFRLGWMSMGNYLVNNGLIEQEDLPQIEE
jgi:hypothetical protein